MSDLLRCTGCQAALRLRPEHAGKTLRCPRCKSLMSVPALQSERSPATPDDPPPLPAEGPDTATTVEPSPDQAPVATEDDLEASRDDYDDGYDRDEYYDDEESPWLPCPRCGATHPERVHWTFWGSFYGPALFNHVRCLECGAAYNGKTGRSNLIPALIFVTIPLLLIMGLIGVITWVILLRQY